MSNMTLLGNSNYASVFHDLKFLFFFFLLVSLQSGKVQFGYIYGVGVLGSACMYALLNLMSTMGVSISTVISVLGYCLLPMLLLAGVSVLLSLQ